MARSPPPVSSSDPRNSPDLSRKYPASLPFAVGDKSRQAAGYTNDVIPAVGAEAAKEVLTPAEKNLAVAGEMQKSPSSCPEEVDALAAETPSLFLRAWHVRRNLPRPSAAVSRVGRVGNAHPPSPPPRSTKSPPGCGSRADDSHDDGHDRGQLQIHPGGLFRSTAQRNPSHQRHRRRRRFRLPGKPEHQHHGRCFQSSEAPVTP